METSPMSCTLPQFQVSLFTTYISSAHVVLCMVGLVSWLLAVWLLLLCAMCSVQCALSPSKHTHGRAWTSMDEHGRAPHSTTTTNPPFSSHLFALECACC